MADALERTARNAVNGTHTSEADPSTENAIAIRPTARESGWRNGWRNGIVFLGLSFLLSQVTGIGSWFAPGEEPLSPTDYTERTRRVLKAHPYD